MYRILLRMSIKSITNAGNITDYEYESRNSLSRCNTSFSITVRETRSTTNAEYSSGWTITGPASNNPITVTSISNESSVLVRFLRQQSVPQSKDVGISFGE